MKETEDIVLVRKFLRKRLSRVELLLFKERFEKEPDFAQKVKDFAIKMVHLRTAERIIQEDQKKNIGLSSYLVAASIAAIIVSAVGLYFIFFTPQVPQKMTQKGIKDSVITEEILIDSTKTPSANLKNQHDVENEKIKEHLAINNDIKLLFANYFEPYPPIPQQRGEQNDLQIAMQFYKAQMWDSSANVLQKLNKNDTVAFYLGNIHLKMNQDEMAIERLSYVANNSGSRLSTRAQWYLALAYLKVGDKEKSRKWLLNHINDEGYKKQEASYILHKF